MQVIVFEDGLIRFLCRRSVLRFPQFTRVEVQLSFASSMKDLCHNVNGRGVCFQPSCAWKTRPGR